MKTFIFFLALVITVIDVKLFIAKLLVHYKLNTVYEMSYTLIASFISAALWTLFYYL